MFERSLDEQNVSPRTLEFSSLNSILRCVNRGVGLAVCPQVIVEKKLADGRLTQISCEGMDTSASVIMVWHAEKWCSPNLKRFMEIAETHIT